MPTLASGLRISSQLGPVETIPQTHRGPHGLSMIRSVKRAIVGMSGDPSNIRLMFVYRRARRVRWRLPPPPPSRNRARTPGSFGGGAEFFRGFRAISAVAGGAPEKRGTTEARWQPVCRRSSREPGFVVRGGRFRDTRPRKADGGSDLRPAECCRPGESARGMDPSYISRMSRINFLIGLAEGLLAAPRPASVAPTVGGTLPLSCCSEIGFWITGTNSAQRWSGTWNAAANSPPSSLLSSRPFSRNRR